MGFPTSFCMVYVCLRQHIMWKHQLQTSFNLKPSCMMLLMLKPCVGMVWEISSEVMVLRMVVFPALSRPKIRIRASMSSCRSRCDDHGEHVCITRRDESMHHMGIIWYMVTRLFIYVHIYIFMYVYIICSHTYIYNNNNNIVIVIVIIIITCLVMCVCVRVYVFVHLCSTQVQNKYCNILYIYI